MSDLYPETQLPYYLEHMVKGNIVADTIHEVVCLNYEESMYDVLETESNLCVFNSLITHQCAEGNYEGGWTEKTKEQILFEILEAKKYSAAYKYKPYSFNSVSVDTLIPIRKQQVRAR